MPSVEFITWCVDVLASRYGWTRTYCLEGLYWEEFWEHVTTAANMTASEKNIEFGFQYKLHASKKDTWKDIELPFPIDEPTPKNGKDASGVNQLPPEMRNVYIRN